MKAPTKKNKAVSFSKNNLLRQQVAIVPQVPENFDPTLALIERAARDRKVDVAKMRELMNMKIEYEKMIRQDRFQQAMIACQMEMTPVVRAAENEGGKKGKYAKLEAIVKKMRPVEQRHGFALTYTSRVDADGQKYLGCWIMHTGGHKEYHELPGYLEDAGMRGEKNKTPNQGIGVMVSYMRRYLRIMIFDIVFTDEDDNDGEVITEKAQPAAADKFSAGAETVGRAEDLPMPWKQEEGVIIQGKTTRLKYKVASEGGGPPVLQAANYLKAVIDKRKHKQSRVDLINENLQLVRALVEGKHGATVTELHALADKGE